MNARRLGALALLAGAGILFMRWLRQWAGDPPLQRTSHKEAIERPENVASYSRFMGLLPLRLIRGYLARYAAAGSVQWRVLDVGCGPGWFPLELADRAPDAVVIGVDLSYPMIAEAVGHAASSQEKQRVLFAQARGETLPFADGAFDLIVSTLALHHWQDPVAVLEELRRVAQPAGRIIVFDTRRDVHPWLWTVLKAGQSVSDQIQLCEDGEPSASVAASYTASETHRLALQAGWERAHVKAGFGWIMLERPAARRATFAVPPVPIRKRDDVS